MAGGTVPEEWIRPARKARVRQEEQTLAERMRGQESQGQSAGRRLRVLKCNWRAYQVLLSCQFTYVGMSGVCIGIAAAELARAISLHRVPRSKVPQVRRDVELMARIAASEIRKQQEADRAKKGA